MKVLASDGIVEEGAKLIRDAGFELVIKKYTYDELLDAIEDFDAIIVRSATKVTNDVIERGKKLKVIARAGVGLDNIDTGHARNKGIPVVNTPGASSISVAELALAHMFAVARFLNRSNVEMLDGKWPKKDYSKGFELTGKTLGLIGFGNIGKETAKRALGIGMKVIAYDPYITETDMDVTLVTKDELLVTADIISLHLPYIKSEGPALGPDEFAKMKKGMVIIQCARGGVVSEDALLDALNDGTVKRAGIDVWENEPITDAQMELVRHPNVSVTPHIGASTVEAQIRVGTQIAQKVIDILKNS